MNMEYKGTICEGKIQGMMEIHNRVCVRQGEEHNLSSKCTV